MAGTASGNDDIDFDVENYVHKLRITSAVMSGKSRPEAPKTASDLEGASADPTRLSLEQVSRSV